ncbi:hypothetical protein [Sphingobium fluviale]|uniref:hypothetical protein n=1 Tax=Sphingobium fluviale TaxID=2506423 RepID=UPI001FE76B64|nr:hypothetical protein [Sphingobium fluviale]
MRNLTLLLTVALALPAQAAAPEPAYMPGVWSLGETKNCESGPAWVFLADGYYAEVTLPDKGPSATGLWKDEGNAIAYTHSHMPFPDMMMANELKRLTVEERTPDRLTTRNYRGVARIFHRCPVNAVKAAVGQAEH